MPRSEIHLPLRRALGLLLLMAVALSLLSCDRLNRKPRRYGASCGQDAECE